MRKKDTRPIPKNYIGPLLEKIGKHANWLADKADVSYPHMSRMINRQSRIHPPMAQKIADALGVSVDKVVDFEFGMKSSDPGLLSQALTWLLEDAARKDIKLSPQTASRLAVYIHNKALADTLNFAKTKDLTFTIIDALQLMKETMD